LISAAVLADCDEDGGADLPRFTLVPGLSTAAPEQ
jgi:hypothetical protein